MALGDLDTRWKNPQGSEPNQLYLWAQELIKELRKGDFLSGGNATGSVTNAQLANMAAWTIKMRNNAAAGVPQDQTINDLTAETSVVGASDYIPIWDASAGTMDKATPDSILAGVSTPPGLIFLTSGSVSAAASLNIVLTSYTAYRALKIVLTRFLPVNDDVELWLRMSTNGGSSYDAGATDYAYGLAGSFTNGASAAAASTGTTRILIAGHATAAQSVSNVSTEANCDAEIVLWDQTATGRFARAKFSNQYTGAALLNMQTVGQFGSGVRIAAQDTDAVQFLFETGNIASGNWALYGYT